MAPSAQKPQRPGTGGRAAGGRQAAADRQRKGRAAPPAQRTVTAGAKDRGQEDEAPGESDPIRLTPRRLAIAFAVAAVSLSVYLKTLFPSVAGGDATEFAFAACQLSVPHPPGYPTYLILSHLFTKLWPWGSLAAKANAATAFCGSGAAAMMFLATEASTGSEPAALVAAGIFAFGRLVWSYAVQSEVFALNNLLAAAMFYLVARYERRPSDGIAYCGSFLCGLAATNQHTLVFYAGPVVLIVLFIGRGSLLRPRQVLVLLAALVAGMLPYAVLVWRSSLGLPGSWGDLTSLDGFLTHFLRREYGTFRLFAGAERGDHRFLLGLQQYATNLLAETHAVGIALLALGVLLVLLRAGKRLPGQRGAALPGTRAVVVCWLLYTLVFHYISNLPIEQGLYLGVHARFWMQSHVASHQLLGVGAAGVFRLIDTALLPGKGIDRLGPSYSSALAIAAVAAQIGRNYEAMDESSNLYVIEYGRQILRPMPEKARLIVKGDMVTNTARYLQVCEGYRADVQMVDMSMMTYPWFKRMQAKNVPDVVWPGSYYHPFEPEGFSMKVFLDANIKPPNTHMYMAGGWHPQDPTPHGAYMHIPWGLADQVVPVREPFDFKLWKRKSEEALPVYDLPSSGYPDERWESIVLKDYYQAIHKRGHMMLQWCERNGNDVKILQEAEAVLVRVVQEHPRPEAYMYRNLGVVYQQLLATPAASNQLYSQMAEAFRGYLKLASPGEPGYKDVVEVVRLYYERMKA